jgi:hypothetical protein
MADVVAGAHGVTQAVRLRQRVAFDSKSRSGQIGRAGGVTAFVENGQRWLACRAPRRDRKRQRRWRRQGFCRRSKRGVILDPVRASAERRNRQSRRLQEWPDPANLQAQRTAALGWMRVSRLRHGRRACSSSKPAERAVTVAFAWRRDGPSNGGPDSRSSSIGAVIAAGERAPAFGRVSLACRSKRWSSSFTSSASTRWCSTRDATSPAITRKPPPPGGVTPKRARG